MLYLYCTDDATVRRTYTHEHLNKCVRSSCALYETILIIIICLAPAPQNIYKYIENVQVSRIIDDGK